MRFSWEFLLNMFMMLDNDDSNLQTKFGVHITSNIFKKSNLKITGSHQPPDLPTLKTYPTSGEGDRFEIFSLKWRERMNLKVPGAILSLGCAFLSTGAKTVWGLFAIPCSVYEAKVFHFPSRCHLYVGRPNLNTDW